MRVRHRPILILVAALSQVFVFYLGRLTLTSPSETDCAPSDSLNDKPVMVRKPKTYLLIIIMSAPGDADERQTIRETWLKLGAFSRDETIHLFPVGTRNISENERKRLENESHEHGDLIFINKLHDSFANLAKKTAYSMEAAVREYDFKHVLKTDTDSFVRVGYLLKALRDIDSPRLYWGFLDGRAKPFRRGKYKESAYVLCDRYLPYQLGGGYVLSHALASFIADHVDLLKFYRSEDVSVGFWLAGLQTKYVHDPRFDTEYISRGCNNRYLVTHKHSAEQLHKFADTIRQTGQLCEQEFQSRPSYVYDFSVPPSECCHRTNGSNIP